MITEQELCRTWLFESLESAAIQPLLGKIERVRLARREVLFRQGDACAHFYLVRQGTVKLYRLSPDGKEKVVDLVTRGQSFAEAVVFMQAAQYPVTAEAIEDAELLAIPAEEFLAVLKNSWETGFRIMATLSRRMHELLMQVDELTLHNATYRVVSFLLNQHTENAGEDIAFNVPKYVVASRLSIKPETLSRIFARLREAELIEVDGDTLHIVDEQGLKALLESTQ